MKFKKNLHVAKEVNGFRCQAMIQKYPPQYNTPRYMIFMRKMLADGWIVKLYEVKRSKYVFIIKGEHIFKIRFSDHKPIYTKEIQSDCDFYVGRSHKQTSTTEEIIKKINELTS